MAVQNGYGVGGSYRPPAQRPLTSPLALAAAGSTSAQNPFGFQTAKNTTGYGGVGGASAPIQGAAAVRPPVKTAATSPTVAPLSPAAVPAPSPSAATLPQYDINTDPALQGVNALTGESDTQAQADALKQKSNILLGYGSGDLAKAALGDANLAAAAAGNPSSTLAQLGQQQGRNAHDLTENLNANNLLYSGYRVTQEQQAAQDYSNALAKAAAEVQGGLGIIDSNLAGALGQNQAQRTAALNDAANRAIQAAIANGTGGPAAPGTPGINDVGVSNNSSYADLGVSPPDVISSGPSTAYNPASVAGPIGTVQSTVSSPAPHADNALSTALATAAAGYGSAAQRRKQAL